MDDRRIQGSQVQSASPRLLDVVREAIRARHYSRRTEETYVHWIKRFILFSGKRHPRDLGFAEVTAFLNDLATSRHVAAATQNQALAALLFLYKEVLAALTTLGYSVVEAQTALQSLPKDAPDDVEERLRMALQYFRN